MPTLVFPGIGGGVPIAALVVVVTDAFLRVEVRLELVRVIVARVEIEESVVGFGRPTLELPGIGGGPDASVVAAARVVVVEVCLAEVVDAAEVVESKENVGEVAEVVDAEEVATGSLVEDAPSEGGGIPTLKLPGILGGPDGSDEAVVGDTPPSVVVGVIPTFKFPPGIAGGPDDIVLSEKSAVDVDV
ncbi:hypothetical protein HK097_003390 [Rhizophlyctis rosea]|uniref:Uncharacterized protein n=1 Tax=Rhizophlyctis rosea TaxID=64517 RepID=A0AAD5SL97_9FUNG|nr:hypothetical protein HK097_003390 [Rhizophlyctis rosea]